VKPLPTQKARRTAVAEPWVAEPSVAEPSVAEPWVAEPWAAHPGVALNAGASWEMTAYWTIRYTCGLLSRLG